MTGDEQIAFLKRILEASPGITLRRAMERLNRMVMAERLKAPMTVETASAKMKAIANEAGMEVAQSNGVAGWLVDWERKNGN